MTGSFRGGVKRAVLPQGERPRTLPMGIARGLRMPIDFGAHTRLYLGVYELELNRHIRAICTPGVRSLDVGGQHGYDALVFAKLTRARVVSFDTDPDACARMRQTFLLNPALTPLIQTVEAYVGDGAGQLALDDFAASPDGCVPDFVKIDVEGAEAAVLRGARKLLAEVHPRLIIEVHSLEAERECGALLAESGYRPTIVNQRRVLRERRPIDHNRWLVA